MTEDYGFELVLVDEPPPSKRKTKKNRHELRGTSDVAWKVASSWDGRGINPFGELSDD